jgi:putative membrane protein
MTISDLPAVNASLNALSTVFLTLGYIFIKQRKQNAHRNCMVAALITSTIFLASYLTYHFAVKAVTKFQGQGIVRPIYFLILITHVILAVVIVPLILVTLNRALKQRWELHKKISRWTWPLWMYVSVTGVVVYMMLYQWFPAK